MRHLLFEEVHRGEPEYCYLLDLVGSGDAVLGHDPEETRLPPAERTLQGVAWLSLDAMQRDVQVARVIAVLGLVRRS